MSLFFFKKANNHTEIFECIFLIIFYNFWVTSARHFHKKKLENAIKVHVFQFQCTPVVVRGTPDWALLENALN